jgi:hypothetical protein
VDRAVSIGSMRFLAANLRAFGLLSQGLAVTANRSRYFVDAHGAERASRPAQHAHLRSIGIALAVITVVSIWIFAETGKPEPHSKHRVKTASTGSASEQVDHERAQPVCTERKDSTVDFGGLTVLVRDSGCAVTFQVTNASGELLQQSSLQK